MKGQAFDTFKLLIAAVVAIAILGILLQILNLIKPPGADPETIIQQQLQKAYGHIGSVTVSDGKASFTKGQIFSGESYLSVMGQQGVIEFQCGDSIDNNCLEVTGTIATEVEITQAFDGRIKAKCASDQKCCVQIGEGTVTCTA